ncbi:hypothetical protein KR067_003738 [Drosophila pandora]|nr:hypothetical protein KR067_003738 [Drosophila pandora]
MAQLLGFQEIDLCKPPVLTRILSVMWELKGTWLADQQQCAGPDQATLHGRGQDAICSFDVTCLGSLPLKDKVTSLQCLQEPLRQLYVAELANKVSATAISKGASPDGAEENEAHYYALPQNCRVVTLVSSRDKGSRDWSRSPEYSSHRSRWKRSERSRSQYLQLPRPPASIDSPTRPRSLDTMDYDDEDSRFHYKMQASHYRHSSESLHRGDRDRDDEERSCTPRPFSATMRSLVTAKKTMQRTQRRLRNTKGSWKQRRLRNTKGSWKQRRLQLLPPSTPSSHGKCHCSSTKVLQNYKRRNFVLQQFFSNDEVHLRQAAHVVQIALSFQAAGMQPQPAFKIRHIKLGARMAEPRGCSEELFQHLLKKHQFEAVFKLYHEPFMAFSIKL